MTTEITKMLRRATPAQIKAALAIHAKGNKEYDRAVRDACNKLLKGDES